MIPHAQSNPVVQPPSLGPSPPLAADPATESSDPIPPKAQGGLPATATAAAVADDDDPVAQPRSQARLRYQHQQRIAAVRSKYLPALSPGPPFAVGGGAPGAAGGSEGGWDGSDIYDYVLASCQAEEQFHFLQFEFLHRVNVVGLQNRLAVIKSRLHEEKALRTEEDLDELHETLKKYVSALKDYAYIREQQALQSGEMDRRNMRLKRSFPSIHRLPGKPFDSHYAFAEKPRPHPDSVRAFLRSVLPLSLTYSHEEKGARQREYEFGLPPHGISDTVDRLARFLVAFTGGAFLIVPMLIMAFHSTTIKSVITTSSAVLLFSVALSFAMRASNVETMISTATYAAVLVVFVGTNNNGPS